LRSFWTMKNILHMIAQGNENYYMEMSMFCQAISIQSQ
jgi:hypothetical protein